jgi:hypothetical protein
MFLHYFYCTTNTMLADNNRMAEMCAAADSNRGICRLEGGCPILAELAALGWLPGTGNQGASKAQQSRDSNSRQAPASQITAVLRGPSGVRTLGDAG